MAQLLNNLISALENKGWKRVYENPFTEQVSQQADAYFYYVSKKEQQIGACFFQEKCLIRLRLADHLNQNCRWFESTLGENVLPFVDVVCKNQDQILANVYLNFYLDLSTVCPTSILAWEQWEKNYR